jgi:hypothetical protein
MRNEIIPPDDMDRTSDYYLGAMDAVRYAMDNIDEAFPHADDPRVGLVMEQLNRLAASLEDHRRIWFKGHLETVPMRELRR